MFHRQVQENRTNEDEADDRVLSDMVQAALKNICIEEQSLATIMALSI
jgi:hypothetical protein